LELFDRRENEETSLSDDEIPIVISSLWVCLTTVILLLALEYSTGGGELPFVDLSFSIKRILKVAQVIHSLEQVPSIDLGQDRIVFRLSLR